MPDNVRSDVYFSIIPEWLIEAVSPRGYQLYGILMRYADSEERTAFPTRTTLAKRAKCSTKTIDRTLRELLAVGAVSVESRFDEAGDQTSNLYTVHFLPYRGGDIGVATPRDIGVATRGDTNVAHNQSQLEPEPLEPVEAEQSSTDTLFGYPLVTVPSEDAEIGDTVVVGGVLDLVAVPPLESGDVITIDGGEVTVRKARHDALVFALIAAFGWNRDEIPEAQWGRLHKAAKDLAGVGADPNDVKRRVGIYRLNYRGAPVTPNAIATNWPDLDEVTEPVSQREVERAAARHRTREALRGGSS